MDEEARLTSPASMPDRLTPPLRRHGLLPPLALVAVAFGLASLWLQAGATPPSVKESKPMAKLQMPQPKRVGPPDVVPVQIGALRFEAVHWGRERGLQQNGGIIAAIDATTGTEQWTLEVYHIDYHPKLETDVQDVFIESLQAAPDGKHLLVKDEKGRCFEIDIATRSVRLLP